MPKIERNHPVCIAVPSAPGLCVVGSSGSVILMGYSVGCGGDFQVSGQVYLKGRGDWDIE